MKKITTKTLEERAEKILKNLRSENKYSLHRPFVVEITGTPNAGKDTLIELLEVFFRRAGWRVLNPPEGAEVIKKIPRDNYLFAVQNGIYALSRLLCNVYSLDFDLIIFDRALYDNFCWNEYLLQKGIISRKIADINQNFFTQPEIIDKIDLCFFTVCSVHKTMKYENRWSLTNKKGAITNSEIVKILLKIWRNVFEKFQKQNKPVVFLDTTRISPKRAGQFLLFHILKGIEDRK